jgi:hypothetical protein
VREIGATDRNPVGRAQLTRIWEDRTRSRWAMSSRDGRRWRLGSSRLRRAAAAAAHCALRTRVERTLQALRSRPCPRDGGTLMRRYAERFFDGCPAGGWAASATCSTWPGSPLRIAAGFASTTVEGLGVVHIAPGVDGDTVTATR